VLGLVFSVPLLSFLSISHACRRDWLTLWIYVDIPPVSFLQRLQDAIDFSSFWSGLIRRPSWPFIIA